MPVQLGKFNAIFHCRICYLRFSLLAPAGIISEHYAARSRFRLGTMGMTEALIVSLCCEIGCSA